MNNETYYLIESTLDSNGLNHKITTHELINGRIAEIHEFKIGDGLAVLLSVSFKQSNGIWKIYLSGKYVVYLN